MTEPEPPPGGARPDEAVLEELAQAFAEPPGDDESAAAPSEIAAPEAPTVEDLVEELVESDADDVVEVPVESDADDVVEELVESDAGDVVEVPVESGGGMIGEPTVARRTIRIGSDEASDEPVPEESTASSTEEGGSAGRQTIKIGGGEDDLLDAVYLDDELASDGDSGTVFIDDDGADDALAPKDATKPGMEPRLRQRRIGVRRAANRRRLKWMVLAGFIVVVVVGAFVTLGSSLFSVETVEVTGALYTDADVLDEVVEELEGTPTLTADTGDAESRLEEDPWVESARVRTHFPDRVTIEIREREPLVSIRGVDGKFRILDREGRVLESVEGQPVAMVLVSGPGTLDAEPGAFAPIGHASAASLVTKFTPAIRSRVDSILVTPDGSDLRLVLTNGENPPIVVEFGSALGDNDQIEKLVRLERVLEDLINEPVTVINVSTPEVTVL